jgi:hypothetical protein
MSVATRVRRAIVRHIPLALLRESLVLFIAAQGVLVAVIHFAGLGTPTRMAMLLPPWLVELWHAQVLVGCTLVLVGVLHSYPRMEGAGLRLMAPCQIVYAIAILVAVGWAGAGSALPQVLFGVACLGRGLWIAEYLQALQAGRELVAELRVDDEP